MKKSVKALLITLSALAVLVFVFFIGVMAGNDDAETIKLISLDYVENNLKGYIDGADKLSSERIDLLLSRVAALEKTLSELKRNNMSLSKAIIAPGESITLSEGCEIICVSGLAVQESGSLCDTTSAKVLQNGEIIESAHICVALENSTVTSRDSENITIFIRGEYHNG